MDLSLDNMSHLPNQDEFMKREKVDECELSSCCGEKTFADYQGEGQHTTLCSKCVKPCLKAVYSPGCEAVVNLEGTNEKPLFRCTKCGKLIEIE